MSLFVVLVGFNASGKTTLAKKLENDLGFNVVSGDPLRRLIKQEIRYFNDFDISIPTEKGKKTREIIHEYRRNLSRILLESGQSVIYDSNALSRSDRQNIFESVTKTLPNVKKVILFSEIAESELLSRLKSRPEKNWLEHHELHKKPFLEVPTPDECDEMLVYNQTNYSTVKSKLAALLP